MTQFAATLEFPLVTQGAQSPGSAPYGAEASLTFSTSCVGDPEGGAGVSVPFPQLWGSVLTSAEIWGGNGSASTREGSTAWRVELAASNATVANAAAELALKDRQLLAASGSLLPVPFLRISGAALAALGVVIGGTLTGRVTYRAFGRTSGPLLGTSFLDTSIGESAANPTSFLRRMEAATNGGTKPYGGATMTALDPLDVVWLAPGDIGGGAAQIPSVLANNSATQYNLFPGVFVMRSTSIAGVRLIELRADPITTKPGQLTLLQVIRAPTHSRWEVSMRGQRLDVIVAHPAGSDLRTAVAAFQKVWAPLLGGTAVGLGPVTYEQVIGGAFRPVGVLNNCSAIDSLRFIEPMDSTGTIYTVANQT